jgi:spermidine/putrescine transport system ATP-binding protein
VDKGFDTNENIDVVIRPEDIEITSKEEGTISGVVESVTFKGVHYEMMVKSKGYEWMIHSTIMKEEGREIGMNILPENIHIMKKVI